MERQPMRMLLIEDDLGDARLWQEVLTELFEIVHDTRLDTALLRLDAESFDIVLLDLALSDSQGLATFAAVFAQAPDVPIVVLTDLDDERLSIIAVQQGAQDYLIKKELTDRSLIRAVQYAIERHRLQIMVGQVLRLDLQRKETFLSHVSHELRSPLAAIYQFVTIMLDGLAGEINAEQHKYLDITLKNVKQLQTMIHDLLEISRAETGKLAFTPTPTDPSAMVSDTLNAFTERARLQGIELLMEVPKELPQVCADPDRVLQILSNLIDNGLKFTPAPGTLTVQAGICDNDPNFLCVTVRDTGCGVKPEDTAKLFDRLYQLTDTSYMTRKGLGLGLYICKTLVTLHGGRIWVESQYGSGATFYFTLPIFSLATVLTPLLTMNDLREIVLTTVVVHPEAERPLLPTDQAALREVPHLLERCIYPDRDLLVPGSTRREEATIFFIVACAAPDGAKMHSQRITQQLAGCEALHDAGLAAVVSWAQVAPPAPAAGTSCPQGLADIVHEIESMMDATLHQERN